MKSNQQRVERVVTFTGELARALREEFDSLWQRGGAKTPEGRDLTLLVDDLLRRVDEGERFLQQIKDLGTQDRLKALYAFRAHDLSSAAKGLEAKAAALRTPAEPAPKQEPGDLVARKLASLLGRWGAAEPLLEVYGFNKAPVPPPKPDPVLVRLRNAFDAAYETACQVMTFATPRLALLKASLEATGLPGRRREEADALAMLASPSVTQQIEASMVPWLPHLARLFLGDMYAVQRAHMAVTQWGDANTMVQEADLLRTALVAAPVERQRGLLELFATSKLNATIYPLCNLHISFRGIRYLQDFFPAPD